MDFRGALANLPILNDAAAGLGFFSFPPTPGRHRAGRAAGRAQPRQDCTRRFRSRRSASAQGASSFVIRATGASGEADTGSPAMTALKVGDFEVPTGPAGEFRIYFSGLPSMARISAAELLDPAKSAAYADRLNGQHRPDRHERGRTARLSWRRRAPPHSPGVEVHAEIIDQILSGEFLTRPDWAPGAEIVVAVVLTLILLAAVLSVGPCSARSRR